MNAQVRHECYSTELLQAFNSGTLPDAELEEQIADHLASCPACEAAWASLPRDSMVELLCAPSPLQLAQDDEALRSTQTFSRGDSARQGGTATFGISEPEIPVTIDRYFVVNELGKGGCARVYLAHDPQSQQQVAVKVLREDRRMSDMVRQSLLHEARTIAQLRHPHIVPLYDCRELDDGRCIVVMKPIEGQSLAKLMSSERLSTRRSVKLLAKIAAALDHAHRRGIWHRDVKPANILVDHAGVPYLTDFGMALSEVRQHLHASELAGTYPYMSPEQVRRESEKLDGRSDVWSLGVVLYELLARQRPFKGETVEQLRVDIEQRPHRPLSSYNASIPPALEAICDRCLQKHPGNRYPTAGRLAADLRAVLYRPWKRAAWSLTGLAVLCLLALLVWTSSRPSIPPPLASAKVVTWHPHTAQNESYGYDQEKQRFQFDSLAGASLFRVGETWQHDELMLRSRFEIVKIDAAGRCGVFWALAPVSGDARIDHCCWAVNIGRPEPNAELHLEIVQLHLGPSAGFHRVFDKRNVLYKPIDARTATVYDLEVQADRWEVKQIYLNGQPLIDNPVALEALLGRKWNVLKDTAQGFYGQNGTFAFAIFETH